MACSEIVKKRIRLAAAGPTLRFGSWPADGSMREGPTRRPRDLVDRLSVRRLGGKQDGAHTSPYDRTFTQVT